MENIEELKNRLLEVRGKVSLEKIDEVTEIITQLVMRLKYNIHVINHQDRRNKEIVLYQKAISAIEKLL